MKKLISLILVIFCLNTFGQTLDGFWGIKFGSSAESVKNIMLQKPKCRLDKENSDAEMLVFDNIRFAGRPASFVKFYFVNNKFHTATIYIKPIAMNECYDLFKEMKQEMEDKYFKTEMFYENYGYPYYAGDGKIVDAIQENKASISSFWMFKNPKLENDSINNTISMKI